MKLRKYSDVEKQIFTPDEIEASHRWARAEAEAVALRELRQILGISQAQLAARIGKDQPELSRLERRRDLKLSTLTRFVRALGGELELTARFGNKLLVLTTAWFDDPDQAIPDSAPQSRRRASTGETRVRPQARRLRDSEPGSARHRARRRPTNEPKAPCRLTNR